MTVALAYLYSTIAKSSGKGVFELSADEARALKEGIDDYKDTIYRESVEEE